VFWGCKHRTGQFWGERHIQFAFVILILCLAWLKLHVSHLFLHYFIEVLGLFPRNRLAAQSLPQDGTSEMGVVLVLAWTAWRRRRSARWYNVVRVFLDWFLLLIEWKSMWLLELICLNPIVCRESMKSNTNLVHSQILEHNRVCTL